MRDPATLFLISAVGCALGAMVWGIQMAMSGDHLLAPAHAHLALVGWVTLSLFAIYYRLTPAANAAILARVHAAIALAGLASMAPGIAIAVQGGTPVFASLGAILTLTSMAIFFVTILRHGFAAGSVAAGQAVMRQAASTAVR
ncbi:MAG TPA: hypothetical protein PKD10_14190 [Paracoccaceae bacterium]|nr:hypothetical protein [Paracoccaceae bacterium]